MRIRVLIVDDEPWARKRIAALLKPDSEFEVVGQAGDGADAVAKIAALAPDLVFLDVQMPEADGFEVLEAVGPEHMPAVIFATAYDNYALRAFDASAVDYLLKPFDEERFGRALERARKEAGRGRRDESGKLHLLLDSVRNERKLPRRLLVKTSGRVIFLRVEEVDWVEASGNYVTLHAGAGSHLMRGTISSLEPRLDPGQFVRIHRSTIVNLDRVKELQPWFRGEQVLLLKDGVQLTVGRAFRERLQRLAGNAG